MIVKIDFPLKILPMNMNHGDLLKHHLFKKGMTQKELADKIGKTKLTVFRHTKSDSFNESQMKEICKGLGLTKSEFLAVGNVNGASDSVSLRKYVKVLEEKSELQEKVRIYELELQKLGSPLMTG